MANSPIRILYIDDYPADRALVRHALQKEAAGFELTEAVSRLEFEDLLKAGKFDLVLSDFNILGFEGLQVLDAVHAIDPDLPVVIATGTGSEEIAVECMKRGAADYVLKTPAHIRRLPLTIRTALAAKRLQSERDRAEEALRQSEERFRKFIETSPDGISLIGLDGLISYVSPKVLEIYGHDHEDEILGHSPMEWIVPEDRERAKTNISSVFEGRYTTYNRYRLLKKDGSVFWGEINSSFLTDAQGIPAGLIAITRDITERWQAEVELGRRAEELAALNAIAAATSQSLELDVLLPQVCETVARVMGSDMAVIYLVDENTGVAHLHAHTGISAEFAKLVSVWNPGEGLTGRAVQSGEAIFSDYASDNRVTPKVHAAAPPWHAFGTFPIRVGQRVVGVLNLASESLAEFSPEQVRLIETITSQLGAAIENARLLESERQQRALAEALRDTAAALNSSLDRNQVLDAILDCVGSLVDYDTADVLLLEPDGVIRAARSLGYDRFGLEAWAAERQLHLSEYRSYRICIETGQPLAISDTQKFEGWVDMPEQRWLRSFVCAPVRIEGETIGFINLNSATAGQYNQGHTRNLAVFADQAAIALNNARLYAALSESEERFSKTFRSSPLPISVVTFEEGRFVDVNEAFERLSGFASYELIGRTALEMGMWSSAEARQQFIEMLHNKRWIRGMERDFYARGGKVLRVLASFEIIELDGQECILALFLDITERVQSEVAIRRYTRQLEALHEASLIFSQLREPAAVGRQVLDTLEKMLNYRRGAIAVRNEVSGELELLAHARMGLDDEAYRAELERVRGFFRAGAGITRWVAEHGEALRLGDVRGDPRYLEANGRIRSELAVPLKVGGRTIGAINIESERLEAFSEEDERLMTTLANTAAVAIENARLFTEIRERHDQLRALSVRLTEVEEAERRQLARELHDRVGQNLTALNINLSVIRGFLPPEALPRIGPHLDDAQHLVSETTARIRDLMGELRPPELDDYGLSAALRWFGEVFSNRTGLQIITPSKDLPTRLPPETETTLFRITQEALTNVAKHAQAQRVEIRLEQRRTVTRLTIADDGIGFDPAALPAPQVKAGWGLPAMRERAEAMGARLRVDSALGIGTQVVVEVEI